MFIGALLAGCTRVPVGSEDSESILVPQFSATSGLSLPETTRQSLGLRIADVTDQNLVSALEFQLRVYQADRAEAKATGMVTPEQSKKLEVSQELQVRVNDERTLTGKIIKVSHELEKATGMVEVLVAMAIASTSEPLSVGAFVRASITGEPRERVVAIPRTALLECSDGYCVYTVSGDSFVRTSVKVGAVNGDLVEIRDGLYTGDQVVMQPVMSLWLTELAAVKGGQACCIEPPKGK
jgi:multidrug efflux pump subunit AcrA (membrane-fusion protein)